MRRSVSLGLVLLALLVLLASCRQPTGGDTGTLFNAIRFPDYEWYQLEADLVHTSDHALIYVERGQGVSASTASAIGTEFDNNIYDLVRTTFGPELDVDANGRIILLLLDIQDGFSGSGGFIAGYFDATHAYRTSVEPNSNEADMLFMDVNPLKPGSVEFLSTIVHEMQHMVSFARAVDRNAWQDIWIDEGLSMSAEFLYLGEQLASRVDYFNNDPAHSIRNGNTFYVWDDASESGSDVLADYSTAYLFFQWLYTHAEHKAAGGGVGLLQDIHRSDHTDYSAVEAAATSRIDGVSNWAEIYSTWLQANLLNGSGLKGYRGEISTVTVHDHEETSGSIDLKPGGAVYSSITLTYSPSSSKSDIVYQGVTTGTGAVDTTDSYDGDRLITHNANVGSTTITGLDVPPASVLSSENDSSITSRGAFEQPYRIDAPIRRGGGAGVEGLSRP